MSIDVTASAPLSWEQLREVAGFDDAPTTSCERARCRGSVRPQDKAVALCPECIDAWQGGPSMSLSRFKALGVPAAVYRMPQKEPDLQVGNNRTTKEPVKMASIEENPNPRSIKSRVAGAFKEGGKRASVEFALEEGQKILVGELMRGYRGNRSEKQAVRKFLLWFFSMPAGQVAIAAAISGGAPFVAGLIGKDGPGVQTVADEFANRAATITTKEGMKFAARQLKPLLGLFSRLFESAEEDAPPIPAALNEPQGAPIFDMSAARAGIPR